MSRYDDLLAAVKTLAFDMHRGWKHVGDGSDAALLIDKMLDEHHPATDPAPDEALTDEVERLRAALRGEIHAPGPSDNQWGHNGSCVKCLRAALEDERGGLR